MSYDRMRILAAFAVLLMPAVAVPGKAWASCCHLVKPGGEPSSSLVRVCEGASGPDCANPIFEGALGPGVSVPICVADDTLLYREFDPAVSGFGPPTTARCDEETDVEI